MLNMAGSVEPVVSLFRNSDLLCRCKRSAECSLKASEPPDCTRPARWVVVKDITVSFHIALWVRSVSQSNQISAPAGNASNRWKCVFLADLDDE